ncbi:SMI1/KNR4 family protein [Thiobacillus sp.]|uniref:SMI1/KNR4 family protein n=1 Tax=Thiobacillus sp. TaxID=924 RepID=UPI0025D2FDE4|nr:SMI1/KNR4 family protein [Thiobacillus sp.]MBT9540216.1 SMI1/KNR4 family protein [Thiobacillus sp.]
MNTIAELLEKHRPLLQGTRMETEATLQSVESRLRVTLPSDVKWFLQSCGYGPANAIPNIVSSVSATERFRCAVGLPAQYVVLDDRNDAGTVLLDTTSPNGPVLWVDTHALPKVGKSPLSPSEAEQFGSFASWVAYCIEVEVDETAV